MDQNYRQRLSAARTACGLSMRQMAEMLLTDHKTYRQWETGIVRCPGIAVVAAEAIAARAPKPDSLRGRILRAAHARATAATLAREIGVDVDMVRVAISGLRADGWPVHVRRGQPGRNGGRKRGPMPETMRAAMRARQMRNRGWTLRQIGDALGVSGEQARLYLLVGDALP